MFRGEKRGALQLPIGMMWARIAFDSAGGSSKSSPHKTRHTQDVPHFGTPRIKTYNGQEAQQRILSRRHGIVRVRMIGPAGYQHPLGLVFVVHLLERHGCVLNLILI